MPDQRVVQKAGREGLSVPSLFRPLLLLRQVLAVWCFLAAGAPLQALPLSCHVDLFCGDTGHSGWEDTCMPVWPHPHQGHLQFPFPHPEVLWTRTSSYKFRRAGIIQFTTWSGYNLYFHITNVLPTKYCAWDKKKKKAREKGCAFESRWPVTFTVLGRSNCPGCSASQMPIAEATSHLEAAVLMQLWGPCLSSAVEPWRVRPH